MHDPRRMSGELVKCPGELLSFSNKRWRLQTAVHTIMTPVENVLVKVVGWGLPSDWGAHTHIHTHIHTHPHTHMLTLTQERMF